MTAQRVPCSRKETTFQIHHDFYQPNGNIADLALDFATEEAGEFIYSWRVRYSLKSNLRRIVSTREDASKFKVTLENDLPDNVEILFKIVISNDSFSRLKSRLKFNSGSPRTVKVNNLFTQVDLDSRMQITVRVRCMITADDSNDHLQQFAMDNYKKFLDGDGDVNFLFGNSKILHAHSKILSFRSPVFSAMFETDMLEQRSSKNFRHRSRCLSAPAAFCLLRSDTASHRY